MSKYDPLYKWLSASGQRWVHATFAQLETILGFELPAAARKYPAWWANAAGDTRHVQCRAWLNAGFAADNLNLTNETVEFVNTTLVTDIMPEA
jgi:hypothetical protein